MQRKVELNTLHIPKSTVKNHKPFEYRPSHSTQHSTQHIHHPITQHAAAARSIQHISYSAQHTVCSTQHTAHLHFWRSQEAPTHLITGSTMYPSSVLSQRGVGRNECQSKTRAEAKPTLRALVVDIAMTACEHP